MILDSHSRHFDHIPLFHMLFKINVKSSNYSCIYAILLQSSFTIYSDKYCFITLKLDLSIQFRFITAI